MSSSLSINDHRRVLLGARRLGLSVSPIFDPGCSWVMVGQSLFEHIAAEHRTEGTAALCGRSLRTRALDGTLGRTAGGHAT